MLFRSVIAGLVIDNCHKPLIQLVGMIAGTIVCYLFGNANRLGGNAVADFTVFGRIAGAAASKYAA